MIRQSVASVAAGSRLFPPKSKNRKFRQSLPGERPIKDDDYHLGEGSASLMTKRLAVETVAQIIESCAAGHENAAEALSMALGADCEIAVGEPTQFDQDSLPSYWDGTGLVIEFELTAGSLTAVLPTSGEQFPDWSQEVDRADKKQLNELARQLGQALLPKLLKGDAPGARVAENLQNALTTICESNTTSHLPLTLDSGSEQRTLSLFWEVGTAEQVLAGQEGDPPAEAEKSTPVATETAAAPVRPAGPPEPPAAPPAPPAGPPAPPAGATAPPSPRKRIQYEDLEDGLAQLPPLARSLLKIRVPVKVTLAETKIPIRRVLEIGPGSILQFNKSCEAPLTLEAGDQAIAIGEAVKVGDKFGLWITTIAMPDERFWVLNGNASQRVK